MTNIYQNTADQIIMLEDLNDEEDKSKRRERPPMYSTLPRSGESKKHNMKESREPTLTGTAKQKRSEKKRLRRIFRSFDEDSDGFLEKREVKKLITSNPDEFSDVSRALSKATLTMKSTSKMSFEQFINLIEDHEDFEVNDFVGQFSRAIVAPRDDSGFDVKPKRFTFYVPIMVIFSLIQIVCYLYDYITTNESIGLTTAEGHTYFNNSINYMKNVTLSTLLKVGAKTEDAYRYLTYQFSHSNVYHLIGNVLIQLLLGIPLEFMHGSWRIMIVYLAGVLSGSVGHVLWNISNVGGASGGVYAMLTAHFASVLMNWKAMRFAFIHLLVVVCIIGKSIYDGYQDYIVDPGNKNVTSHFSHYGGAFAGLLVGIGMLRNFNCSQRKRAFWIICVAIYCATMTFGTLHIHCFRNPITIKINNTNTTNSTTIAKYTLKNVLTTRESEFCKDYEIKLNETKTSLIIFQNNALAYLKNLVPHEKYVSNSTLTNGSNEIIVGNNKTIFITILPIN